MKTREEAVSYPRGRIDLRRCADCGFIFNADFDPTLLEYSDRYEETQGFSPTFRDFHRRLAERLIERWDVRGKRVLEIGCGKGEFLALLCELGGNAGVGFDPAFIPERGPQADDVDLRFHTELFPPDPGSALLDPPPDFLCCKMTLEHIAGVRDFIGEIRDSFPDGPGPLVFFQVPDAARILRDGAFWDIYYEHCSYFTSSSLATLFETCGFEVLEVWTDFDDQYLMLTAAFPRAGLSRPPGSESTQMASRAHLADLDQNVLTFSERVSSEASTWRARIEAAHSAGGTVCLWGAGSKAVAFLSAVGSDAVSYAVDVNPNKHGTFLPGSGLEIVGPDQLRGRPPTLVIVMNPVYVSEIGAALRAAGITAELEALR